MKKASKFYQGAMKNLSEALREKKESFSERIGGGMIKIDIETVRISAVKAVQLVVAIRRLAKPMGLDTEELGEMEREFRVAAGELQRVETCLRNDANRPLING